MGSLEKDVRGELIQQVKENKWNLCADVKVDELARLPHFEGHSRRSLLQKYDGMLLATMKKLGKNSKREVTVEEVEEWWKNSTRPAKFANLIEKEQRVMEAYHRVKQELGLGGK